MGRVAENSAWKWYASFKSKEDLNLPMLTLESYTSSPQTPACTLNNLRKHYAARHPEIKLTGTSKRGGRPTLDEEQVAVDFYRALYSRHCLQPGTTADVPIKIEDSDSEEASIKGEDIEWDA